MASFEEWLEGVEVQKTEKGARIDITVYVYPDGHGNICIDGNQPANSWKEAEGIIQALWEKAQRASTP